MTATIGNEHKVEPEAQAARHDTPLRAAFLADWLDMLFIHFRVAPHLLCPAVPLELDLYDGCAYVTLAAFTQARLRPTFGGRVTEILGAPLARHGFLNVRTYVRCGNDRGIYFLREWIPNRLAVLLGPMLYGLPYHLGTIHYHTNAAAGVTTRHMHAKAARWDCRARWTPTAICYAGQTGSQEHFLMERYTAFTLRQGRLRRFRIAHAPWPLVEVQADMKCDNLLAGVRLPAHCAAYYSTGVHDVRIGRPEEAVDWLSGV